MNQGKTSGTFFLVLITFALLLPVLAEHIPCPSNSKNAMSTIPYHLNKWAGQDVPISEAVLKNYNPLDVSVTWRKYTCSHQLPVECLIQQASNYENLHDLFQCLVFAGAQPKRLGLIKLKEFMAPSATLFEYRLHNQSYYSLFCYQSKAGTAIFPPRGLYEEARLAIVGRVPCRLCEINTQVAENPKAAISRLTELASAVCAQPL